jgi:hypothetical protein
MFIPEDPASKYRESVPHPCCHPERSAAESKNQHFFCVMSQTTLAPLQVAGQLETVESL